MKKRKRKPKIIKDPNARGEWAESVFMARAGEQGLAVSKPWGESNSYDFVVGRPGRFVGVQVKSTTIENGGGYVCVIRKQGGAYARGSFDFVAAYVVPEDVWYIIPANRIRGQGMCESMFEIKTSQKRRIPRGVASFAGSFGDRRGIGDWRRGGGYLSRGS